MELFGFAVSVITIALVAAFFIALSIGVYFDRCYRREEPKWWVFGIGLIFFAVWFWPSWTVMGIFSFIKSPEFWNPLAVFIGIGVVYALIEFIFDVRRSAAFYANAWEQYKQNRVRILGIGEIEHAGMTYTNFELVDHAGKNVETTTVADVLRSSGVEYQYVKQQIIDKFISQFRFTNRIIYLSTSSADNMPVPTVHRTELAEHLSAWTFFWPFYAVSFVLGDLVSEVMKMFSAVLTKLSGRFIKIVFADVFKL